MKVVSPAFVLPCVPKLAARPPTGAEWVHEAKHAGWRIQVVKDNDRIALCSRRGIDLADRFSALVEACRDIAARSSIIDGELVPADGAEWSGNAAGRPKGSRNKLSEEFIAALCEDFELHGEAVIETVRKTRPTDYLKIVAALVPKEFSVEGGSLEDLSDEELAQAIADIRILAASTKRAVKN